MRVARDCLRLNSAGISTREIATHDGRCVVVGGFEAAPLALPLAPNSSDTVLKLDFPRQRSLSARYAKARRGELVVAAPVRLGGNQNERVA